MNMDAAPTVELVWSVKALLGEGPVWVGRESTLWFVDILRGCIHSYDPRSDARRTFPVGGRPSFVAPRRGGGLLVGNGDALHAFDGEQVGETLASIDMPSGNRLNDAGVGYDGRLWFGTMDASETQPTGLVHVWDGESVRVAGGSCVITNGPALSPDGRWLYHVDTLARVVWRFDVASDHVLAEGHRFIEIAPDDGVPDGVTIDSDGCVWVALWDGWAVRRYAPDGTLLMTVPVPCARVTKLALGGPDLAMGYVTTARVGLSESDLERQPSAGGLFAFPAPAPGIACPLTA